jgi:hypothetical protein
MKVERSTEKKKLLFESLKVGEEFALPNNPTKVYMRVKGITDTKFVNGSASPEMVELETGILYSGVPSQEVLRVNGKYQVLDAQGA